LAHIHNVNITDYYNQFFKSQFACNQKRCYTHWLIGRASIANKKSTCTGSAILIKPWIFEFLQAPTLNESEIRPSVVTAVFNQGFALWLEVEKLGYEGIFFSEHHFGLSYSPSPKA
jgi:hypothetical protein